MRNLFIIILLSLSNNVLASNYDNGKCFAYAEISQNTQKYLYKDVPVSELYDYVDPSQLNDFFKQKTKDDAIRHSIKAFATVIDASKTIRHWEKKAMINIGIAQKGIEASNKFIQCATNYDNIEIIKGKKDLLEGTIENIEETQALLDEMMTELAQAYSEDRPYKLVLKKKEGESKREAFLRSTFESTVNLTAHGDNKSIKASLDLFYIFGECHLIAVFSTKDNRTINLDLDFTKGIGWIKPSPGVNVQFTDTDGNTLDIAGKTTKLQYIQFDEKYTTSTLNDYFLETHEHCYIE